MAEATEKVTNKTIAIIRVVTLSDSREREKHAVILKKNFPQFNFVTHTIEDQEQGIHDAKSHQESIPKIIKLGEELEDQVDAILISCAADPAVLELKKTLAFPVGGAGRPSALFALNLTDKIGVVGMGQIKLKVITETLGDKMLGYQLIENISDTREFSPEQGKKEVIAAIEKLNNQVAAIILACTGMSTIQIAKELQKDLTIPVLDPLITGALFLQGELMATKLNESF